ncbi:MAG TPA: hypothetical protein VHP33_10480 [Polyangiaceae bacterium]|nr:hypothetical protein [Polyangiaceae bacterium]
MIKASAFIALVCVSWTPGCSSDADSGPRGAAAGSSSGGSGGAPATTAGTTSSAGTATAAAGVTSTGGAVATAGSSSGGAATAGTAQGGQAGQAAAGTGGLAGAGGGGDLPPLEECTSKPSVDRLTSWSATNEGTMVPSSGSILVKEGADYVGKVEFIGAEWHVVPVLIANQFDVTADLSKASGITITYSATSELHVQLRSKSHWSGGDQYATTLPSTSGQKQTKFFSFAEANWKSLFGAPVLSFADTLKEGMGLVFVGNSANTLVFYGLRIDGYSPPCQ